MDRGVLLQRLASVEERLVHWTKAVNRQRNVIDLLRQSGVDPSPAQHLLHSFERGHAAALAQREELLAKLALLSGQTG